MITQNAKTIFHNIHQMNFSFISHYPINKKHENYYYKIRCILTKQK